MRKLNVMLYCSESQHPLKEWVDVQSAYILDFEYCIPSRVVKIVKKNEKGSVFVMPANNSTLIIEEIVEKEE